MAISMVTAPLALVLYGAGLEYKLPFMVPIFGLSLRKILPITIDEMRMLMVSQ